MTPIETPRFTGLTDQDAQVLIMYIEQTAAAAAQEASGVMTLGIGENRRDFVARINSVVKPRKSKVFTKLGRPSRGTGGGFFVS